MPDQFREEVGGDDLYLSQKTLLLQCLQNGNAVRGADVDPRRARFAGEQIESGLVGVFWAFVRLDGRQQRQLWCVAGHANDGSSLFSEALQRSADGCRIARREDDAVEVSCDIRFHQFNIAFPETGIRPKIEIDGSAQRSLCRGPNAGAQGIEERLDLLWEMHSNPDTAIQLEASGGYVRLVVELLRHFKDLGACLRTHPLPRVECAVDRSDRNT